MEYLIGTASECDDFASALDDHYGVPVRGVVRGGPDRLPLSPGPGWTLKVCSDPIGGPIQSVVGLPDFALDALADIGGPAMAARRRAYPELPQAIMDLIDSPPVQQGFASASGVRK